MLEHATRTNFMLIPSTMVCVSPKGSQARRVVASSYRDRCARRHRARDISHQNYRKSSYDTGESFFESENQAGK